MYECIVVLIHMNDRISPPPPPSALLFQVAPSSGVPIYKQLMEQIERLIRGGQLESEALLPSVREVASQLEVNPMTVSKAYSMMEAAGWLTRLRGKGMIVAPLRDLPAKPSSAAEALRPTAERLVEQARQLKVSSRELLELVARIAKKR